MGLGPIHTVSLAEARSEAERSRKLSREGIDPIEVRKAKNQHRKVEAVLLTRDNVEPHDQLVIERQGSMDTMHVDVEASPSIGPETYDQVAADVQGRIKTHLGVACDIKVMAPGEKPRSEGKAVRVRDLRSKK